MERRIIYKDNGGTRRTMIFDDGRPFDLTVHTEQDLETTIEVNREMAELHPRRSTNKLVARGVPITVAEQALREDWDENDWKKWLNNPDNAAFRVWRGMV